MAWSGGTFTRTNGVYSGSTVWAQDKAASVKITAARHDTHDEDLADGIDACLTKDGSNAATADLDLGGFKYTNAASGTARAHLATLGQTQDSAAQWAGTSGGSANAYTLTLTPAITAYAAGQTFRFVANHTNTGAATVAVNGLTAKTIQRNAAAVPASFIVANRPYEIVYDGTNFQLFDVVAPMTGADGANAGVAGLVPTPSASDNVNLLRGDGTWVDAQPGMVLLASASASNDAAIDFTSGIDNTYDRYVLTGSLLTVQTDNVTLDLQLTQDGGSNWLAANYSYIAGSPQTSNAITTNANTTASVITVTAAGVGNASGETVSFEATIDLPSNASVYKTVQFQATSFDQNGALQANVGSGAYMGNTSAINGIRVIPSSGNIVSGELHLYGVRRA